MSEHLGTGPDGQNLLGFMCSVGVLAELDRIYPERRSRMRWELHGARWRPVWSIEGKLTDDEIVAALQVDLVARGKAPEFTELGDRLPASPETLRSFAKLAVAGASPDERTTADFAAAFGCEALTNQRGGAIQDTAFRTVNTGQQRFLAIIREVHEVSIDQVREALFGPWRYRDHKPALRWDPIDARDGAVRGKDPSKTEILTVRAANALASEALRFFCCAPRSAGLATTGFSKQNGTICFSWPIWTGPIRPDVLRSLLNHPELVSDAPNGARLHVMRVALVCRARRIETGGQFSYRNFARLTVVA